jgi:hypothetical protein
MWLVGLLAVCFIVFVLLSKASKPLKPVEDEPPLRQPAQGSPEQWLIDWQAIFEESFPTKIHGVDQGDDGVSRQEIIGKCESGDRLRIARETSNAYDPNALQVVTWDQKHLLGYLSKDIAKRYAPMIDAGGYAEAIITKVTGGTASKPSLGVNIMFGVFSAEGLEEAFKSGKATRIEN